MHYWIWFDRHLGEHVPHSTSSEVLFAALGRGPAGRAQTLKQAVLYWKWMAKLGVDYCNKIAEGRGRRGGQTFIHRCRVESLLISISGLGVRVGRLHSPMCCGGVFSWLCAHIGSTWCDRWWWRAQRWWLGCQSAAAEERRSPWWNEAGPSGSSWSSAPRSPRPSLTHRCSPAGAVWLSGRTTTDLKNKT